MARIKTPKKIEHLSYYDNCGVCARCTIPGWFEAWCDAHPVICPECKSKGPFRIAWHNNPCDNIAECENGHRIDVREFVDEADVDKHQKTIDELNKARDRSK
jgi:hypothetical protein